MPAGEACTRKEMRILSRDDILAGYRIEDMIGVGGMGIVYRAEQVTLSRTVALKVLSRRLSHEPIYRERFRREGALAAALHHPHVVPVYDSGEADGVLYLAMMLVEGPSLADILDDGPLPLARTLSILAPIADALDAAHSLGIVHRDVKPQNILIGRSGVPMLADFGVAKAKLPGSELTRTREFLGSVNYAAPEQIRGEPTTAATDLFALAAVLFECLAGRPPFAGANEAAVMRAQLNDAPPAVPEAPRRLNDVLRHGLAKDPQQRFETAGEMIAAAGGLEPPPSPAVEDHFGEQLSTPQPVERATQPTVPRPRAGRERPRASATVADRQRPERHDETPPARRTRPRGRSIAIALVCMALLLAAGLAVAGLSAHHARASTHDTAATTAEGTRAARTSKEAPVSLSLSSPSNGETTTTETTTVSGAVAPANSTVDVEGKPVLVSSGKFNGTVRLRSGSNRVQVVASAPDHHAATETVTVDARLQSSQPQLRPTTSASMPTLETESPPGGGYSILVPTGWTYFAEASPEGTTTDVWAGPRPSEKLQVLINDCGSCAEQEGKPSARAVGLPPGTTNSFEINERALGFEAWQLGTDNPDNGVVVAIVRDGTVTGYAEVDLWLPSSQHAFAAQILDSFSLLRAAAT